MTTASTFYQLNFSQQADVLQRHGLFLFTRTEGNFIIDLYELQDLVVELFYNRETDEPVSVMAYNAAEKLKTLPLGNIQPRLRIRNNADYPKQNYAA